MSTQQSDNAQLTFEQCMATLRVRERKFVRAVVETNGNASEAARLAGYAEESAAQTGSKKLRKANIKRAISLLFERVSMSEGEAIHRLSNIAASRLNDFMKVEPVLRTPRVRKPLQMLIDELQKEVRLHDLYFDAGLVVPIGKQTLEDVQDRHHDAQLERKNQIGRYEIELRENPEAYRDTTGESVWVEESGVDLVALTRSNKKGQIKSVTFHENGQPNKVELYAADSALEKILQLHGRFVQKVEVSPGGGEDIEVFTAEEWTEFAAWKQARQQHGEGGSTDGD